MNKQIEKILQDIRKKLTLEGAKRVFDQDNELKTTYLNEPQDPEEFTRNFLIDKILFNIFNVNLIGSNRKFKIPKKKERKVDYAINFNKLKILLEVKPINATHWKLNDEKNTESAISQIKDVFLLGEVQNNYDFGIATDGIKWIFINDKGKFDELDIRIDFDKIKRYIIGEEQISHKKLKDISKKFYEEYNDLLHGVKRISKEDCLVNSILHIGSEEDGEEIAQVVIDRLIFIKFLESKGIITEHVLDFLYRLEDHELNLKLNQLFFEVMNTKEKERGSVDPLFTHIPYLNGSLFERLDVEKRNPTYKIRARILHKVIEFLNKFKFIHHESLGSNGDFIDPEILGYIFERAMTATDRKGTGAYYTPKEITKYIAENTIYPNIIDKVNKFLIKEKGYKKSETIKGISELLILRETTLSELWTKIILDLSICDNACGSGAFLLAAANVLFELNKKISNELRGHSNVTDTALKRMILKQLYGVDSNPRAIEIAMLRLWLWLVESYKTKHIEPLPNIEYNLRVGNSLIGHVDIEQFGTTRVTLDDFMGSEETTKLLLIKFQGLKNKYRKSVGQEARNLKKEIEEIRKKIKYNLDKELYQEILKNSKEKISKNEYINLKPFHWGFEFYEVFDLEIEKDRRGFDIVIGNPPYVGEKGHKTIFRQIKITEFGKRFYKRKMDIFYFFFHKALDITKRHGYVSFITTNYFITADGALFLRKDFKERTIITKMINFNELKIFDSAKGQHNMITFLQKNQNINKIAETCITGRVGTYTPPILSSILKSTDEESEYFSVKQNNLYESNNNYIRLNGSDPKKRNKVLDNVLKKIKEDSVELHEIKNVNQGILSGVDKVTDKHIKKLKLEGINKGDGVYVLSESEIEKLNFVKEEKNLIKPFFKNSDIQQYFTNLNTDKKLLYLTRNLNIDLYPNVKKHLQKYEKIIKSRSQDRGEMQAALKLGKWWVIFAVRKEVNFDGAKIVCPHRSPKNTFGYNEKTWYASADVYYITDKKDKNVNLKYILALLNSKLFYFWLYHRGKRKGKLLELYHKPLTQIPIKIISSDKQKSFIEKIDQILRITQESDYKTNVKKQINVKKISENIDILVYDLYNLDRKEIILVEKILKN